MTHTIVIPPEFYKNLRILCIIKAHSAKNFINLFKMVQMSKYFVLTEALFSSLSNKLAQNAINMSPNIRSVLCYPKKHPSKQLFTEIEI